MATDTLTAGSNGTISGWDACDSTSSTGGNCAPISNCDPGVLVKEGHYWKNFTSGNHQSWWTSNGTLSVTYAITSGGISCDTDIVDLQYTTNGSTWTSFSGFPKTVVSASGTATASIGTSVDLTKVEVRLKSSATSCSPCDPGSCNYCGVYCVASNIKITAPYTEPTGACCTGASCAVQTEATCGGTYYGDGTTCSPDPCGDPTGRCCVAADDCRIRSETDCNTLGGTYGGDGTNCSGDPCGSSTATGSCCKGSICTITEQSACTDGIWTEDGTCSPSPCPKSPTALAVG